MSKRKHGIHKAPGDRLTDREREMLGQAWNNYINGGHPISLRHFTRIHGIAYETWRREYGRGAAHRPIRNGNRWTYAEYDILKARASIGEGKANMGARMKLTVGMAILFRHFVLKLRRSLYDARQSIVEAFPVRDVPCLRTSCNHIEAGDCGVFHGQTPTIPADGGSQGRRRTRRGRPLAGGRSGTGRRRRKRRGSSATSRWTP